MQSIAELRGGLTGIGVGFGEYENFEREKAQLVL